MITREQILGALPPFKDQWLLLHPDQSVKDIIHAVLDAHDDLSEDYDRIAVFFDSDKVPEVATALYDFCKQNLEYVEERESEQTVASPGAMLSRGHCDCKGYSGFCGGVLSALNRRGSKINWHYRFASYDPLNKTPHHVFIVAYDDDGTQIWIDPTPGSENKQPVWQTDKKINDMALYKITGLPGHIGIASETVSLRYNAVPNLSFPNYPWSNANPWPKYLGLDKYRDFYGDRNINESNLAAQINSAIQSGPVPGHQVTPDFVKWVYDNSIRSFNFYYPGGVDPSFDANKFVPASFTWTNSAGHQQTITPPKLIITKDGRVTFDHDQQLDDYRNALIHILTAGAQTLINKYDASPFPLKPADVKNFSQAYTGNPNNPNASLLHEWRGTSVIHDIGKGLEGAVNFVKDGYLKIVGAVPRNAFLALVGINLFKMATDLQRTIDAGKWDELAHKWHSLGGDPDKLRNTITHGAGKPETDDTTTTVNSDDQISGVTIGNPAVVAAIIAAATPVVVALANYFTHKNVGDIVNNGVNGLNSLNPDGRYQMVNGQLYSNGQPVTFTGDDGLTSPTGIKNLAISAGVAAALYFLVNKKGAGKKKKILLPLLGGVGTYFILHRQQSQIPVPAPVVSNSPNYSQPLLPSILPTLTTGIHDVLTAANSADENSPSSGYHSYDTPPVQFQPYSESTV